MGLGVGNGNANKWTSIKGPTGPAYSCKTSYSLEFDGLTENGNTFPLGNTVPVLGSSGTGNFCISFWFKTPDVTGGGVNQRIFNVTGSAYNWTVYLSTAGKIILTGTPWGSDACNFVFSNDTWYHVAYSAARASFGRWVVNGVQSDVKNISSGAGSAFTNTGILYLGSNAAGVQLFEGNLTEIAFWNTQMNDAEISELYSNTAGKCYGSDFSFSSDLAYYWSCFNPSGVFTNPMVDSVSSVGITLNNMDATNISTDTPL